MNAISHGARIVRSLVSNGGTVSDMQEKNVGW